MPELNKANRQVCDVDIRNLKTKEPFLFFDTANTTTAGLTGESVYAMSKGSRAIAFTNPLEGTLTIEAQVLPFKLYSLMSDGVIDSKAMYATKETVKCETAGQLTLPADVVAGTVFVYPQDEFGGTAIKGTAADKKYTATTPGDLAVGKYFEVGYLVEKTSGVKKISFNNKRIPKDYFLTMSTVEKDELGTLVPYIMTAYKATPQRGFELAFSSEGDPAAISIVFDLLEDKDGNVFDMIEIDE